MAGKFEITKAGDTFSFELFIDDKAVGKSPVFDKEDACKRGVKAVKKNSRMKVQNTLANDEEKTNPKYLVEADGEKVKYTLFLQTGAVALEGSADSEAEVLDIIEKIGNNANAAPMAMAEVVLSENEQKQIRVDKLLALQKAGKDPFEITLASQTHHSDEIKASFDELEGKDVIIIDDMISSGESMIDVAAELKRRKARRVFCATTFGLFTNGFKKFDEAYENGVIDKVLTTNLVYQPEELLSKPWYINVDMSKYIALIIDTLNHDSSISNLLNPVERIQQRVNEYNETHYGK